MRYSALNLREISHPPCVTHPGMGLTWSRAPEELLNGSLPGPDTSHWFMRGLPRPNGVGHAAHRREVPGRRTFNPGVAQWQGQTLLACRVGKGNVSGVWTGQLDGKLMPIRQSFVEVLPYYEGESFEDPRLVVFNDRLFLSCAVARAAGTSQCLMEIGRGLRAKSFREIASPSKVKFEKNWIFFAHGRRLNFIYHAGRGWHEIYAMSRGGAAPAWRSRNRMNWQWGEIRGGTNAVLADGQYWTFFHSQHRYPREWRYFMGAYSFEARPPFRITAYTPMPLYTPPAPSQSHLPLDVKHVIFPSGLLKVGEEWLIFSGYNDERVVVSRISHAKLRDLMVGAEN